MAITINGSGTITGVSAGGLPDGCVTADDIASLPSGSVLQVVQTQVTSASSNTGSSDNNWYDLSPMTATITPSSTSSKVLVVVNMFGGSYDGVEKTPWRIVRGSTAIAIGDASGYRTQATGDGGGNGVYWGENLTQNWLDSPATTSATTYKIQYRHHTASIFYLNRCHNDRNNSNGVDARSVSTITLMEIAG